MFYSEGKDKCKKYKNSNSSEDTKESGKISQKMEKILKKNICRKCTQRINTITFFNFHKLIRKTKQLMENR